MSKTRTYIYVTGSEYFSGKGVVFIQGGIKPKEYVHRIAKEDKLTVYKLIKMKSYEKEEL